MTTETSTGVDLQTGADRIEALQDRDGAISWIEAGIWDAWNHGESVMALGVAGRETAALRALDNLLDRQEGDGGFTGELGASAPLDAANRRLVPGELPTARDTNFSGYVAVTVLRTLTALDRPDLFVRYQPMVAAAVDFVLDHQTGQGDIVWRAADDRESLGGIDSLRAGNASLYKSLECAIRIARLLGRPTDHWAAARARIGATIRENDARFDRLGEDRRRYAMDWYYPALAGVLPKEAARARLYARWSEFVEAGLGCRCVADEPWVTAAETAELAMACLAAGKADSARALLKDLAPLQAAEGGYWMGWQFKEETIWPWERPAWTVAAVMLADDALERRTPGWDVLIENRVPELALRGGAKAPAIPRA